MFHSLFLAHFKRQAWSLALRTGQGLGAQHSVSGAGWDCSRSRDSALLVLLLGIWLNRPAAGGPCVTQMGYSGLWREVHPGHFDFFFFFFPLFFCLPLEKGCKSRSGHGLHGETGLLESWAQPASCCCCFLCSIIYAPNG